MRLIDADALEKDGWAMHRTVQIDRETMEYQTKKPSDFPTIEPERKLVSEIRKWINSGNRGSTDYFIVDKIEEIINRYETD